MAFTLFLRNDSCIYQIFSDCFRLITHPFLAHSEVEKQRSLILLVFEKSVTQALGCVPKTVDNPYEFFGTVRKHVVRSVLGNNVNIADIYLQIYEQKQDCFSSAKMEGIRQRPLCKRPLEAQERIQLSTIVEEEDHCIISMDGVDHARKGARFDPGDFFSSWGALSNFSKDSNEAKAFHFLSQKMQSLELFSLGLYKDLSCILLGETTLTFRTKEKVTYCLSKIDIKSYLGFSRQKDADEEDLDFQKDGFGRAEFLCDIYGATSISKLYELWHLPVYVQERLTDHINEFNLFIERTAFMQQQAALQARFKAITYLFFRIEQLQPVPSSQKVSLFLLNFLLARYGLPPVFFSETFICCGENASIFSLVSFNKLQKMIVDGMRAWCSRSGNTFTQL